MKKKKNKRAEKATVYASAVLCQTKRKYMRVNEAREKVRGDSSREKRTELTNEDEEES
jgi:hypothetical protein